MSRLPPVTDTVNIDQVVKSFNWLTAILECKVLFISVYSVGYLFVMYLLTLEVEAHSIDQGALGNAVLH